MSRSFAHLIVATAVTCLLVLACFEVPGDWNWSGVWEYRQKFISGWLVTLGLSLAALVLSVAIGLVVALFLALNLIVDIIYAALDPRVRLQGDNT